MKTDEIYEHFYQNWSRAMRELGFSKNTYQAWLKNGYIPMPSQLKIEEVTNSKLIADINITKKRKRA